MVFPETLINRYFSSEISESARYEIMVNGIRELTSVSDWIWGKGLSSVIYSGPHNNYIRFVQRIGLIGMLLTFWPFFYVFKKITSKIIHFRNKKWFDSNMAIFSLLCLFFTLFHSFFAYPHEDAYNAPYVWLGLAIGTLCLRQINYGKSSRT
jgi:O-antigen ligase